MLTVNEFEKRINAVKTALLSTEKTATAVFKLMEAYASEEGIIDMPAFASKFRGITAELKDSTVAYTVARKYLATINRAVKTAQDYNINNYNNFNEFKKAVDIAFEKQKAEAAAAGAGGAPAEAAGAGGAPAEAAVDNLTRLVSIASKLTEEHLLFLIQQAEQLLAAAPAAAGAAA